MPSAKTLRTPAQVVRRHWRAGCKESLHAQFGGGPTEKARATETSPAAYPTSRRCEASGEEGPQVLTGMS